MSKSATQTTTRRTLPPHRRMAFFLLRPLCELWFTLCYRYRSWGHEHLPAEGPVLLVSNHQSLFDPIVVGIPYRKRPFYAMARTTLFRNPAFGWLIRALNAIPVDRGSADRKALEQGVEALKNGHPLLIFPEGTRTQEGPVLAFKPGLMLMIRRARPTVVPVAVAGAFDVWPRKRALPRLFGRVGVMFGEPIPAEDLLALDSREALKRLETQVESMRQQAEQRIQRR